MALDTRRERLRTADVLEEISRTGKVPDWFSLSAVHRRIEKTPADFGHTPLIVTGDERLNGNTWATDVFTGICIRSVPSSKPPLIQHTGKGDILYPSWGPPEKADTVIEAEGPEGKCLVAVPRTGGILFGLLGPDGRQESAPVKDLKEVYSLFLRYGSGMMMGEREREVSICPTGMIPVPVPCTDDEMFQTARARELSARTVSANMAAMAMIGREKSRSHVRRFSGFLPNGMKVDGWTAEMLMRKMSTYTFGPFPGKKYMGGDNPSEYVFCFRIPAFSEEQARIIFEKRILEFARVLYRGQVPYGRETVMKMGFTPAVWDVMSGNGYRMAELPPLASIPCTGMSRVYITDFFPAGIWPLLIWSKNSRELPFVSGKWTSDDLGFAFSIIFAPELGLTPSYGATGDSPFVLLPKYSAS